MDGSIAEKRGFMFRLRVVQAFHGDCLILEHGDQNETGYILIDGGPGGVYQDHLKAELATIRAGGGGIHLAVLSHVDDDHVTGLLDLFHELIDQRRSGKPETISIGGLWHNSFGKTLGPSVEKSLTRGMEAGGLLSTATPSVEMQARSIKHGEELTASARGLQIPINAELRDTPDRLVCLDNVTQSIRMINLNIRIIGPSHSSLKDLQDEWEKWLAKQEKARTLPIVEAERAARELDMSVPNLSSIMLLVEAEGKTVLLTGDGRGDHLLEGLEQAGLLAQGSSLRVNVFKLPHHGSSRNITPELFERILADTYIICANGKYDNPDFQTLEWLVQAAIKQQRMISIVATTEAPSIKAMLKKYDPQHSFYSLKIIEPGGHSITVDLSAPLIEKSMSLTAIHGIGPVFAKRLEQAGIGNPKQLKQLTAKLLAPILKTSIKRAEKILGNLPIHIT